MSCGGFSLSGAVRSNEPHLSRGGDTLKLCQRRDRRRLQLLVSRLPVRFSQFDQCRDRPTALCEPKLLHHAHLVPLFPALDHSTVGDAIENKSVDTDAAPGRRDIPESGTVGSFCDPSSSYLIAHDDLIFDGEMEIREGGEEARDHLLEAG